MKQDSKQVDLVKREARRQALAKMGIHTEEQFRQAVQEARAQGLFNIGFLTVAARKDECVSDKSY